MSLVLSVKQICGKKVVTRDDGILINELIQKAWQDEEEIVIDFNNIPIASVSFLDQAIGVFALQHDLVEVQEKIHWKNIKSFDERLLNDILTSRARQRKDKQKKKAPKGRKRPNKMSPRKRTIKKRTSTKTSTKKTTARKKKTKATG